MKEHLWNALAAALLAGMVALLAADLACAAGGTVVKNGPFRIGSTDCGKWKLFDDDSVQIALCPPLDALVAGGVPTPTPTPEPTPAQTPDVVPTLVACPYPVIPPGQEGTNGAGTFAYRQAPSKSQTTEYWCVRVPGGLDQRLTFDYISYGTNSQCGWWAMTVTDPLGRAQVGPGANGNVIQFQAASHQIAEGLYTVILDNQSGLHCDGGNPTYRFSASGS